MIIKVKKSVHAHYYTTVHDPNGEPHLFKSYYSTFLTFWLIPEYFVADKNDRCFPSSFFDCKRMHSMIVDKIVEAAMFKRTKNSNSWPGLVSLNAWELSHVRTL